MKSLKIIIVLFISTLITNCSNDSEEPTIILSNANIAGIYSITSFNVDTKVTSKTEVSGVIVPIDVATSTSIGDTFQIDFELTENETFTAAGQYRATSTVTPAVGKSVTDASIIVLDTSGSFEIDTTNNTIKFSSSAGDFINGTFNVVTFNETSLVLSQEAEQIVDPITTEIKKAVHFKKN